MSIDVVFHLLDISIARFAVDDELCGPSSASHCTENHSGDGYVHRLFHRCYAPER